MRNLNFIVENYRLSSGFVGSQFDQQLLQFAINGMRKLRDLGLMKEVVKATQLTVTNTNSRHVANMPADFNDGGQMIRLGVCKCGVMIQYDANDQLCLPNSNVESCSCTDEDINNCVNEAGDGDAWNFPVFGQPWSYSYTIGSYFVPPVNYRGGYKFDFRNRQIILDVDVDDIVLEYYGDFLNDMGNCIVPEQYIECLTLWLDYERKYWNPDAQIRREAPSARVRWYQVVRDLNSKGQALNKHNWLNLFRSFMFQGTKV